MDHVEDHSEAKFHGPIAEWSAGDLVLAIRSESWPRDQERRRGPLTERLRDLIRRGTLPPGARIPATRALAEALAISRGVVVSAYEQLLTEGFLVARQGSGTRVAAGTTDLRDNRDAAVPAPVPSLASPGVPDLGAFPRSRWLAAYRTALAEAPSLDLGYGDAEGHSRLRTELADHLRRTRAAVCTPDSLIAIGGVAQGLALLTDVLLASGRGRVGIEDPCSPGTRNLLVKRGVQLRSVPVDEHGLVVDALAELDLGAVLVSPAHQYPTGTVLTAHRRQELVAFAREHDVLLIEDDYDGMFRYMRDPVGCVQGLAPDVTVLLGSVSKTLSPALRLGWLVAPHSWVQPLTERRKYTDLAGATIEQLALAHMLRSGGYDRHIRRMQRIYHARRKRLVSALRSTAPELAVYGDASGLHLLVALSSPAAETAVIETLTSSRFDVLGLTQCRATSLTEPCWPSANGVVIGFAALREDAIDELVRRLVGTVNSGFC